MAGVGMDAETIALAIWHDAERWRERSLAGSPGDQEWRRGFHLGLACLIVDDIIEAGGGDGDVERLRALWGKLGLDAAMIVLDGPEEKEPKPAA